MSRTWLTVDTDDAHHRPWRQGHPTRSKDPDGRRTPRQPSEGWLKAIARFGDWVERSGHAATVFVIQDQLEQPDARKALLDLAARGGPRLTFASHGTSHRAWGAWPEDAAGLTSTAVFRIHGAATMDPEHHPEEHVLGQARWGGEGEETIYGNQASGKKQNQTELRLRGAKRHIAGATNSRPTRVTGVPPDTSPPRGKRWLTCIPQWTSRKGRRRGRESK